MNCHFHLFQNYSDVLLLLAGDVSRNFTTISKFFCHCTFERYFALNSAILLCRSKSCRANFWHCFTIRQMPVTCLLCLEVWRNVYFLHFNKSKIHTELAKKKKKALEQQRYHGTYTHYETFDSAVFHTNGKNSLWIK